MPHNPSAMTPWGNVIPLRTARETTVERVYREQGRKFSDGQQRIERDLRQYDRYDQLGRDPIDLRVNQLKLRVHPPIPAWQVCVMLVVAAAIGAMLAVQL